MLSSQTKRSAIEKPNEHGIDFVEAAVAHIEWRSRLRAHIDGDATQDWPPSSAGNEDECGLGRWLRGMGRVKFGHFSAFRQLEAGHSEFHYFAGLILSKVLEGQAKEAEALLRNEFAQATRRILISINEMKETMQQGVV